MMKIETLEALLKKRVGCLEIAGEGTLFSPPPVAPLKLHTQTTAKAVTFPQARGPSPFVRQHVESVGAECIFVCCFITCSCFIDGDLKAPKHPTVRL